MKAMLNKVKPLKTDLIPPEGSMPAGVTADGLHQLWKRPRKRVRTQVVKDEKGEDVWKRLPNGEPTVRKRTATVEDYEQLFYQLDQGNGNVQVIEYRFPTDDEVAAAKRRQKIAAMQPALAEALVDAGVSPTELLERLRQPRASAPAPKAPAPPVVEEDFPVDLGDGRWKLSNGQEMEGNEDQALAQEIAVGEARRNAALVPEG
jgi:hypothetical protein